MECPFRLLKLIADLIVLDRNRLLVLFSGHAGSGELLLTSNRALDFTISRFSSSMAMLRGNQRGGKKGDGRK